MNTKKDRSIGVIIFHMKSGKPEFLIIKHRQGHWSFPKGHKEKGETDIQTAKRELSEETGITDVKFISEKIELSEVYIFNSGKNHRVEKSVDYFIAEVFSETVKIDNKEIVNFQWCEQEEGLKLVTFTESENLLKKAYNIISNKNEKEIS